MWRTIEKLRRQPDDAKRGIAFFGALAITAFLLVSWAVLPSVREQEGSEAKSAKGLISPFAAVGRVFSVGAKDLGENFSEVKEVLNESRAQMGRLASTSASTTPETATSTDEFLTASSSAASSPSLVGIDE